MFTALFRSFVRHRPHRPAACPPRLEVLEERCLLSADSTTPAAIDFFSPAQWWDAYMVSLPKGNPNVVFLGDSITWGFQYGLGYPVWSSYVAPLNAADYGVPDQTTETLLLQLSWGQLTGIDPGVVVLMIGTNNIFQEHDSPQDTAAGILADINAIHLLQPQAQVLVLGTPPGAASPSDPYRSAVNQTDALVSQEMAGDPRATFVNITSLFQQPDGTISNATLFDYIHPMTQGYMDLVNAIEVPMVEAVVASYNRLFAL